MAIAVKRLVLSAIAALFTGVAIAPSARAVDVYKDSAGVVYITGLEPKKIIKVQYENLPETKQLGTDTCGVLTFTTKQVYANVYKVIDATGTETRFAGRQDPKVTYRCKDGQVANTEGWDSIGNGLKLATRAANPDNFNGNVYYIAGLSPYKQVKIVGVDAFKERMITANTCGIVKLISSEKYPLQRFNFYRSGEYSHGPYEASSLSVNSTPEVCRNGVFYKPCLNGACDTAGPGYAGQPYTGGSGGSTGSNGSNNGSNNGSGNGSNNGSSGSSGTIGGGGS